MKPTDLEKNNDNDVMEDEERNPGPRLLMSTYPSTSVSSSAYDGHGRGHGRDGESGMEVELPPLAGPSSMNGHRHGEPSSSKMNGHSAPSIEAGGGITPFNVRRVVAGPTTTMYPDSGLVREEYVRLVLQSLRDVGYHQAAEVLEAESGYVLESDLIVRFRHYVDYGDWDAVEGALADVGVVEQDAANTARLLIRQQKYLECLEVGKTDKALGVLRNEIAPLSYDSDQLHILSSFMMCASPEDLRKRAAWSGSNGGSRKNLLLNLQGLIPPSMMLPPRRMAVLLTQAQEHQRQACLYHTGHTPFSLLEDHRCSWTRFPSVTTHILEGHGDEVWRVEWSPDGKMLASGGKDGTVIIWKVETALLGGGGGKRQVEMFRALNDHEAEVECLAWSLDGTTLLTGSDQVLKMWNVKTGVCTKEIRDHLASISSIKWMPDGSGFVTSGLRDSNIYFYDNSGRRTDHSLTRTNLHVVDFAISPDRRYLIAVGQPQENRIPADADLFDLPVGVVPGPGDDIRAKRTQLVVFDLRTGARRLSQVRIGDMTSVSISKDSRTALVNFDPDVIFLWDIPTMSVLRRYRGHRHQRDVIRSCFGGAHGAWVISGDEDQKIFVWNRETCEIVDTLEGHEPGTVNAVAWNPSEEAMFASCGDDGRVRIWESVDVAAASLSSWDMSARSSGMSLAARTNGSGYNLTNGARHRP